MGLLALLRRKLRLRFDSRLPEGEVDTMIGEMAKALEDIAVDAVGKAEMRGTAWDARNVGNAAIVRSQRCRVERVEGLTLHLRG